MAVDRFQEQRSELLPEKKSPDHKKVGIPCESHVGRQTEQDDEGNGDVNGQEPLEGEFRDISSPVPERDVHKKHHNRYDHQLTHPVNVFISSEPCTPCPGFQGPGIIILYESIIAFN
jgi:hypothetical protein